MTSLYFISKATYVIHERWFRENTERMREENELKKVDIEIVNNFLKARSWSNYADIVSKS